MPRSYGVGVSLRGLRLAVTSRRFWNLREGPEGRSRRLAACGRATQASPGGEAMPRSYGVGVSLRGLRPA